MARNTNNQKNARVSGPKQTKLPTGSVWWHVPNHIFQTQLSQENRCLPKPTKPFRPSRDPESLVYAKRSPRVLSPGPVQRGPIPARNKSKWSRSVKSATPWRKRTKIHNRKSAPTALQTSGRPQVEPGDAVELKSARFQQANIELANLESPSNLGPQLPRTGRGSPRATGARNQA